MILSGYSSLILEMRSVPIPDPVPPPREWVSWKPWRQSELSASFLITSRTESTNSAPTKLYYWNDRNFEVIKFHPPSWHLTHPWLYHRWIFYKKVDLLPRTATFFAEDIFGKFSTKPPYFRKNWSKNAKIRKWFQFLPTYPEFSIFITNCPKMWGFS